MRAEQVPQGVGVPNASGHNASSAIPPRAVGMAKMVPLGPCPNGCSRLPGKWSRSAKKNVCPSVFVDVRNANGLTRSEWSVGLGRE